MYYEIIKEFLICLSEVMLNKYTVFKNVCMEFVSSWLFLLPLNLKI